MLNPPPLLTRRPAYRKRPDPTQRERVFSARVRPTHICGSHGLDGMRTEVEFAGDGMRGKIEIAGEWPGLAEGNPFSKQFVISVTQAVSPIPRPKLDLAGNPLTP